jgi:hypothetical protein
MIYIRYILNKIQVKTIYEQIENVIILLIFNTINHIIKLNSRLIQYE